MAETVDGQVTEQVAMPNPDLKTLQPLIGRWKQSGVVQGEESFQWLEGGYFIMHRYDFEQNGQKVQGIEVIGHLKPFGEESSPDIWSRSYDNQGNTYDYVYEIEGHTLTTWAGMKDSPAYFRGTFSADWSILTGDWVYPGGGYHAVSTRVV